MSSGSVCEASTRMNHNTIRQDLLNNVYYANSDHSREQDISVICFWASVDICIPLLSSNTVFHISDCEE